jgi:UrcA family protein
MKIALSAFCAISLLSATVANAESRNNTEARQVMVATTDLNLASPAGMATLQRRLAAAVKRVCPSPAQPVLTEMRLHRECVAQARSSIAPQIAQLTSQPQTQSASTASPTAVRLAR